MKQPKMVNPPLYRGSTVLFDNYEDMLLVSEGKYEGSVYGTDRLPNQRLFEEALQKLEGGFLTRAFQSGISAIQNALLAFVKSGDHVLVCDNAYGPGVCFCKKILPRFNIEADIIPPSAGKDIVDYIKPNTRLILLESPGSITFEIQDIPAITAIAKEKNIITALDNTWATPLYLKPFDLGIDISIQSVTKYISGHSDVLLGAVTVNEKYAGQFEKFYRVMEFFASPEECYLAARGLETLALRLKEHERSALEIAKWLKTVDLIGTVIYPALPEHPQHDIWKRDFTGAAGIFSFVFKEDYPTDLIADFVNALELFGIGFSWGGYKSLITAGKNRRVFESEYKDKKFIRLNIGLEKTESLISDLERGFSALR